MKFAYADPPYFKQGKKHYGEHHDAAEIWDSVQAHTDLINKLIDEYPDGWALSCNPQDVLWLGDHLPKGARLCAWVKEFHQIRPLTVQHAWEMVILYGGRKVYKRNPFVRDWLSACPTRQKGLVGAKPDAFNDWVLDLLNFKDGDQMDDLFTGTGSMSRAVERRFSMMEYQ